ncbi:hypothetical protein JCM9279_005397 [Rhodotorula babjevae]
MLETLSAATALQNWTYTVKIVQQPVRARMCGLGDRDRRPISPPLIVQLHAYDPTTGRETPVTDIDTTFLILAADLRSSDAQHDANLVPSSTTSSRAPTISTCSSTAASPPSRSHTPPSPEFGYPSPASSQMSPMSTYAPSIAETAVCSGVAAPASPPLPPPSSTTSAVPTAQPPSTTSKKRSRSIDDEPQSVVLPLTPAEPPAKRLVRGPSEDSSASCPAKAAAAAAAFIPYVRTRHAAAPEVLPPPLQEVPVERAAADVDELHEDEAREAVPNLIGTLHTNAHKLKGVEGGMGVYFVLPDLSVRTEGAFRIRVRLLSIGVRRARCESLSPVVADAHSDEFRVFSAKKFEGMLDPTPLSQCFAKQGVRIPTRRVTKARAGKASAATASQAVAAKEEEA